MANSIYQPLRNDEVRLITLHAGQAQTPLRCSIHHANLDAHPTYTALSYTWGDANKSRPVLIKNCNFNVTYNLYDALEALRLEHRDRVMWIDAIAINQQDTSERNREVLRMRKIYSLAEDVEVWLGKAEGADYLAMEAIHKLAAEVDDPEAMLAHGLQHLHVDNWQDFLEGCTPSTIHALNGLFTRPWWTRVWVVQELSLAKQDKARVTCGTFSLPWTSFLIVAYAFQECWFVLDNIMKTDYPNTVLSGFQNGIRMAQCRHVRPTDPHYHLLELLHQHRDCEATNPQDYIYGLLGLSGDGEQLGIRADYDLSPEQVYTDFLVNHVTATVSLDILCACRFPRNFHGLPSFVPDWSTDQRTPGICINERYCGGDTFAGSPISHFERYRAAGESVACVTFQDNGKGTTSMTARSFIIGKIVELGVVDDGMTFADVETFGRSGAHGKSESSSETFNQWLNMVLDSEHWDEIERTYRGMQNVLDAFCRVLVGDRNNRMVRPREEVEDEDGSSSSEGASRARDTIEDDASDEWMGHEIDENSDSNDFDTAEADEDRLFDPADLLGMTDDGFRACIQVAWGKRFAILDTGYMGIVPAHAVVDDVVSILLGCTLPLVVRTVDIGEYQLVGESYFHGVTDGELMDAKKAGEMRFV